MTQYEREPNLDDTVADEEVESPDSPPAEGPGPGTVDKGDAVPLADDAGHEAPQAPRSPPPVPVFGHSASNQDDDVPLTRRISHELPPPPPPSRSAPPPSDDRWEKASDRRWRPDLSDTPGLEEDRQLDDDDAYAERLPVDDIFDRPERLVTGSTAEYDPEAGRTNVAIKIQAVRQVVQSATSTPFGRLIISLPIALAGVVLSILAITQQMTWMIVAASLVMPLGAFLVYRRYQAWLGHKRYMYRLLETLGEDVSDFDPVKADRRVGRAISRSSRR